MIPSTVMIGFCNGLAIVIGQSQLHPFEGKGGSELACMIIITIGNIKFLRPY